MSEERNPVTLNCGLRVRRGDDVCFSPNDFENDDEGGVWFVAVEEGKYTDFDLLEESHMRKCINVVVTLVLGYI